MTKNNEMIPIMIMRLIIKLNETRLSQSGFTREVSRQLNM